jgi:thioredoxin reductase (NADPH)
MEDELLDLAVIGAGPCGIAVGAAATKAGLSALLFDRGPLCASLVAYPPYLTFFSTSEKLEIEDLPFPTTGKNPTRLEALVYYRKVAQYFRLSTRLYEEVEEVVRQEEGFLIRTLTRGGRTREARARNVVVATGGFHEPNFLGVPGEDLAKVSHYYTEAHPYWNQSVVVVGGGNSAVEAALELYRANARITLVHFLDDFDRGVKPWILPDIRNRIEAGEIAVRWRTRVAEIRPDSVVLRGEEEGTTEEIPNDFVLALTGRRPDPTLLRSLGVPVDPDSGIPAHDPETMETPVPGVFLAGVLAAGNDANKIFIENGRMHGGRIVRALAHRT